MKHSKTALLKFEKELNSQNKGKELSKGLSAVLRIGDYLWVANDEAITIERLHKVKDSNNDDHIYDEHQEFRLDKYLSLPIPSIDDSGKVEEIDLEGLDYRDGYLWLVASHSLKRSKPDDDKSAEKNFERLAKVSGDGNRYLLARIPLVEKSGTYEPEKETKQNDNKRTAAQLPGDAMGNSLMEALAGDKHLQQFLTIPGKDNGFDIEGLAAVDNDRIYLGLRGPVLRGWAVILEMQLQTNDDNPSMLKMNSINPNNPNNATYRKHFLDLGGLGIRDLCVDGSDLLILAGPTISLDGPVSIFRWKNGVEQRNEESFIWCDGKILEKLIDITYGEGTDHAEGMTPLTMDGGKIRSVLIVYDSASEQRQKKPCAVTADIFDLY